MLPVSFRFPAFSILITIFSFFFFAPFPLAHGACEGTTVRVEWKEQHLSVNAKNASLNRVLQEVAKIVGMEFKGSEDLQEPVTVDFTHIPLPEALERLLAGYNYSLLGKVTAPGDASIPTLTVLGRRTSHTIRQASPGPGQSPADDALSKDLLSPDPNIRYAAYQKLIQLNPANLKEVLYMATKDKEPLIRELAFKQLIDSGDSRPADILLDETKNPDSDIRRSAVESAVNLSQTDAAGVLAAATEDENVEVRFAAFQQLVQMEYDSGMAILRERMTHSDPEVRIMALEVMASRGTKYAYEVAMAMLNDGDELVRGKAENIISELQAKEGE